MNLLACIWISLIFSSAWCRFYQTLTRRNKNKEKEEIPVSSFIDINKKEFDYTYNIDLKIAEMLALLRYFAGVPEPRFGWLVVE
jgi:hypothetical protein